MRTRTSKPGRPHPDTPELRAIGRELNRRSAAAQGLPEHLEDTAGIATVVGLLRERPER